MKIPKARPLVPLSIMGLYVILYVLSRRRRDREDTAETRRRLVDDAGQCRAQVAWLEALYAMDSAEERP